MRPSRPRMRSCAVLAVAAAVLPAIGGCPAAGPATSPDGGIESHPAATFAPAPPAMRRLTRAQYLNSVRDLLGMEVALPVELEADTPLNGFASIGAARITIPPVAVERYEAAALALAEAAMAPEHRDSLVPCRPDGVWDEACAAHFLGTFGRRAWRRPLDDLQLATLLAVAKEGAETEGDFYAGLKWAIATILQSPRFLFRQEQGVPDPNDPTRRRYDDWEMATRLSYFLWNTTPDDALLDAAAAGRLTTDEGIRAEVRRLLADPRARDGLRNFFSEFLQLDKLDGLAKDPDLYPQYSDALASEMRLEVLRTVEDLLLERGESLLSLYTSRHTWVGDGLAALYGLPPAGGEMRPVDLPPESQRVGLLGKAAFLAVNAHVRDTSPTYRGRFVRENLLCTSVPSPPPGVNTEIPAPDEHARTLRERLAAHQEVEECAACHKMMDPIGFGLENFDAIGQWRDTDNGVPIDATGELDGVPFDGPESLARAVANHPKAAECLVRQIYRYATAHVERPGEAVVIDEVMKAFDEGSGRFEAVVEAIALSRGFREAGPVP